MAKNNANPKILEVTKIDGLINRIVGFDGHLNKLNPETTEQQHAVFMASEAMARFQKDELHNLRKAFE